MFNRFAGTILTLIHQRQHGKVCKPYNSVLGEHFRAHWDILPVAYSDESPLEPTPLIFTIANTTAGESAAAAARSDAASVRSTKSTKSTRSGLSFISKNGKSPSTAPTSISEANVAAQMSNLNLGTEGRNGSLEGSEGDLGDPSSPRLRVVYVTEQVSHHPPVSAYFASCPSRFLELSGIDQIAAKVSGTTLRVAPGQFNQGIFIKITGGPGEGERYHITHPVASVNGILRGSFYVTVGESTIITCTGGKPGNKFRTVIEYKEEVRIFVIHRSISTLTHRLCLSSVMARQSPLPRRRRHSHRA